MHGCHNSAIKPQHALGKLMRFVVPLLLCSDGIHKQPLTQNSHIFPAESPGVLPLIICFPAVRFRWCVKAEGGKTGCDSHQH